MTTKTNINYYRLKLIMLYSSLDMFLLENPDILITIDNPENLYSYSDKLKLIDAIELLENKYTSFSLMDLKIRCTHYIVFQYGILDKLIDYMNNYSKEDNSMNGIRTIRPSQLELFQSNINIAKNIKIILHAMVKDLLLAEELQYLPTYLINILAEKKLYKVES